MELKKNMKFDITEKFIANFYQAKTLKITDIHPSSVRIEIENARGRGVIPKGQFHSLIRTGALILIEQELANNEGTA